MSETKAPIVPICSYASSFFSLPDYRFTVYKLHRRGRDIENRIEKQESNDAKSGKDRQLGKHVQGDRA
jgi:hypothetical protein